MFLKELFQKMVRLQVLLLTSLSSAFMKTAVKPFVAMTGEITLRGKVFGWRYQEKILAAKRAGMEGNHTLC
ncbi:MAG: S16 family serine protease [Saprospiraceae bacterium]